VTVTDLTTKSKVLRQMTLVPGANMSGRDLSGIDMSGLDLSRVNFNRANLASADLTGARLAEASLVCPVIERTTLRDAIAPRVYAHAMAAVSSDWSGIRFDHSPDTTGALFHGVKLVGASMVGSNFAGTTFYQCDLTGADLTGCSLDHAVFNECILDRTMFHRARMAGCMISRSKGDGCNMTSVIAPDLTIDRMTGRCSWIFQNARLHGLTVRHTDLSASKFEDSTLDRASFDQVSLDAVTFPQASMVEARLLGCHGVDTDLDGVDLTSAQLVDCTLKHATLYSARLENTVINQSRLHGAVFASIHGRGLTVRDSAMFGALFENAYLYRACFTGDPVTGMVLDGADFRGANLIQATIAASMRGAKLNGARGAYMRLNQTDLTNADLEGFRAYKASAVKTVWPGDPPADLMVAPESQEIGST